MQLLLSLTALAGAVAGLAVPQQAQEDTTYDAVIVGGGPAGLSALSALARVRRNVLMIDSASYRNEVTRHMHDVIGFDGTYRQLAFGESSKLRHALYTNTLADGSPSEDAIHHRN